MAKKSNKTEQVLKLITKDEGTLETQGENADIEETVVQSEKVEIGLKEKEEQVLKYEAKLKIEIDPEIEVKSDKVGGEEMAKNHNADINENVLMRKNECLTNISEVLVLEKVGLVMEKMNVCRCESCVNDVIALALNTLPTKYVTTDKGKQYSQLEIYKKQYETDVLAALTKACVRIKASPRHN